MTLSVRPDACGRTDPGVVRTTNEDQFLIAELTPSIVVHETSLDLDEPAGPVGGPPGYLFLVADGLGGRPAGERASRLLVEGILRSAPELLRPGALENQEEDLIVDLQRLLLQGQRSIEADVKENPSREGMATTLTLAYVRWPRLIVIHVGDSRAYLHRSGQLEQLTTDHTVDQTVQGPGGGSGPVRKVLWNVIGGKFPEVSPDVIRVRLEPGDELLLATDGLPRELPDRRIERILESSRDAQDACRRLLEEAKSAGGGDNLTVVDARWRKPESGEVPRVASAEAKEETPTGETRRLATDVAGSPEVPAP